MKIIFFGTPQFAVPSLEALRADPDFDVVAVVTQPDKRRGRGKQVSPSPVKQIALEMGCPIWQPARIKKDPEVINHLRTVQADAFVVVAYGQILSAEILDLPRLGCINAHGSILPDYRGAAPIQWSLVRGAAETGVTTMLMDVGMDTGPMLLTQIIPINPLDTAWDLAHQLATISGDLIIDTLHKLDQKQIKPIPQDDDKATYAPLIQKTDYEINWQQSALAIHNQVRGFYPNGSSLYQGNPLKITETLPLEGPLLENLSTEWQPLRQAYEALSLKPNSPGTVMGLLKNYGPIIATGDGPLLLRTVKPSGKKAQSGWDFVNGNRLQVGHCLGA